MSGERVQQLDGLRGLAILLVLIWHFSAYIPLEAATLPSYIVRLGLLTWSGVDLFFVLSGLLIGGILIDNKGASSYAKTFYIRRAFRILPLYVVFVALGFVLPTTLTDKPIALGWYASFTQNIWMAINASFSTWAPHTWSLAVEEQFYLLLPALVFFTPRRWLPIALVALIITAPIFRCALVLLLPQGQASMANYVLLPARMDGLLIGALSAYAIRQPAALHWLKSNQRSVYVALGMLLIFPAVATAKGWSIGSMPMNLGGYTLMAAFYACLLLAALTTAPFAWLFSFAWLRRCGKWAYCLYLIHYSLPLYVFWLLGRDPKLVGGRYPALTSPTDWAIFALAIVAMLCIAWASWRYFEGPLVRLGHRWKYGHQAEPAPPSEFRSGRSAPPRRTRS